MVDLFGRLWGRFADDFLNEVYAVEYNSIKHGLRVSMGGFSATLGKEDTPGVPARAERMVGLGGSEFGISFFIPSSLHNNSNFWLKRQLLNWVPGNLVRALHLIDMSINNVLACLRVLNGVDPDAAVLIGPDDEAYFDSPWLERPGVTSFNVDMIVSNDDVEELSSAEILARYQRLRDQLRTKAKEG
jgi:hypothetical protein